MRPSPLARDAADLPIGARLVRLTLTQFRNHRSARLAMDASAVLLSGPNGAGKTNILEAVSLFAPGRGLRGATFAEMACFDGAGGWAVAAEVETAEGQATLGTAWRLPVNSADSVDSDAAGAREVRIDGRVRRGSGLFADHLRVLWLTPAMDRLFAGAAGDRRRFLDRMVVAFDAGHAGRVSALERLVKERNRLLAADVLERTWMAGVEEHLAAQATAVAAARLGAISALSAYMREGGEPSRDAAFPWSRLAVEGDLEDLVRHMPAVQAEDEYRRMLHDSRARDRAAGRTLCGPHRSDLAVMHGPKDCAARQCSTGEQKALLIGLVLAHAQAVKAACGGAAPVLLLDEVAAHLDAERRAGLFERLARLGGQAWMTGTDRHLFAALEGGAAFTVDAGRITAD